jgi:hypothetical protein
MEWKNIFLERHACTHSRAVSAEGWWKEEDTIWSVLSDEELRTCPEGRFNSIVWLLWHMARCEDVAVNAMLRQDQEVLDQGSWLPRLGITTRHIGTGATMAEVIEFSQQVNLEALRAYRAAVGRATRHWIQTVPSALLEGCLDRTMVDTVLARGDLGENARWVADYWVKKEWTKVGFLNWLAVEQHWFHIGEAWVTRNLLRSHLRT